MFKQNSKKQTTLSFGSKKPIVNKAVESVVKSYRKTPYDRPDSQPRTTATKTAYFGNTQKKGTSFKSIVSIKPSRLDSFGAELSQAVNSFTIPQQTNPHSTQHGRPPSKAQPPKGVKLSERQLEAFDMAVNQCESMFITGSAGTGKSVLLREIIKALREKLHMRSEEIQITASTGIAAFHIGGKTLHSFAGVGLGKGSKDVLLKMVKKSRLASKRWLEVKVLIIDEISMLDANLFDALEYIARDVRKSQQFFGGIQVILTGDFYQLPPVEKEGEAKFAFEAASWRNAALKTVVLTHVFRQKDMRFVDILNELRLGRLTEESKQLFSGLSRVPNYPDDGIQPTELYALRHQVDDANNRRLVSLAGKSWLFNAHDEPNQEATPKAPPVDDEVRKKIDGWSMAPRRLELKMLAQVMLIKNMPDAGLVNGSRGVITRFETIGAREYPVVRFANGQELTMTPEVWEIDLGFYKYRRTQLPIILAWALSIHKSQGQTIDRVIVDLGKVFERGQAYVALSRAVNLDSLQVLHFSEQRIMVHQRVKDYYAELAHAL